MPPPRPDAIRGSLLGLALGDALGAPTEFLRYDEILRRWPPSGPGDPGGPLEPRGDPARVTDDTQLGRLWERPVFERPEQFVARGWDEALGALARVEATLAQPDDGGDPCVHTGEGWVAEETLATALVCLARHPDDPVRTIRRAAATTGDSDSIASVAGAFAGARHGAAAWPAEWVERLEYRARLEALAAALSTAT